MDLIRKGKNAFCDALQVPLVIIENSKICQ